MEVTMETVKFVRNVLIGSIVIGLSNSVQNFPNYSNQLKDLFLFTETKGKFM